MYRAKAQGAGNLTVFDQEMHTGAIARLDMEAGLRDAVGRGDLRLHYQPIVDLRSGATFSAEALLRWLHPEHGSIPPERFIPLAEETNLIIPIGQWVLTEACRQAQEWTNRGAAAGAIVSVNLSARQFQDARLVERIHDALRRSGLPANRLCLEITETTVMQDAGSAIMMLNDPALAGGSGRAGRFRPGTPPSAT
ncbi:MAG: EAL domain-containing protein [Dehalococcoidia bacterium]